MKSNPVALLGLTVLAGFLAVAPARAQDAPARRMRLRAHRTPLPIARSRPTC